MRRFRLSVLAAILAGCGGGSDGPSAPRALPGDSPPDVLVVVVDGLSRVSLEPEWVAAQLPTIAALGDPDQSAGSEHDPTAALQTLLAGEPAREHGLLSARELGYHRSPFEVSPVVGVAVERGYVPVAAVAVPQLAPEYARLDGGFAHWATVGTGSPRRTATPAEVAERAAALVEPELAGASPVLAVVQIAVPPVSEVGLPPVPEDVDLTAPFVAVRDQLQAEYGVEALEALLAMAEARDLAGIFETYGRRRGSKIAFSLEELLGRLWAIEIDRATARLVALFERRGQPAVAVLVAPPATDALRGLEPARLVYSNAAFDRGGGPVGSSPIMAHLNAIAGTALERAVETESVDLGALYLALGPGHAYSVEVRGIGPGSVRAGEPGSAAELADRASRVGRGTGDRDRHRFRVERSDGTTFLRVGAAARGEPLRIEIQRDGAPLDEARVTVAGRPLREVPIPRLLDNRGALLPADDGGDADGSAADRFDPRVHFEPDDRGALAAPGVDLNGARFATWPPDPDGALPAPGATGAVRAGAQRALALALPDGAGGFVPAAAMAHGERRALGPGLVLVLPGYDDLELERAFLFGGELRELEPGTVDFFRPGRPFPPGPPIDPDQRRFLAKLPEPQ